MRQGSGLEETEDEDLRTCPVGSRSCLDSRTVLFADATAAVAKEFVGCDQISLRTSQAGKICSRRRQAYLGSVNCLVQLHHNERTRHAVIADG
jgi:hypothetical protein